MMNSEGRLVRFFSIKDNIGTNNGWLEEFLLQNDFGEGSSDIYSKIRQELIKFNKRKHLLA